ENTSLLPFKIFLPSIITIPLDINTLIRKWTIVLFYNKLICTDYNSICVNKYIVCINKDISTVVSSFSCHLMHLSLMVVQYNMSVCNYCINQYTKPTER